MGENYTARQKIGRALTSCQMSLCSCEAYLKGGMPESAVEARDGFKANFGSAYKMLVEHYGKFPPSYVEGVESDLHALMIKFLSLPDPSMPWMNERPHYKIFLVFPFNHFP